ncbi:MAG TPA: hypothetical protein VFN95_10460 [Flavitalea sp.]|nr:hypothetical protein [Flavitalea sp.]
MKNISVILLAFVSIAFFHCSKEGKQRKTVVGEWTFKSKTVQVGPYPSMFSKGAPSWVSTETSNSNFVRVSFNLDGNFTFFYYDKPPQIGQFKIFEDTLLVIQPDTSGFLKFCSFLPRAAFSATRLLFNTPELNVDPLNDTILIRKIGNDEIEFALFNITKAQVPSIPNRDTLVYTEVLSTFSRQ